MRKLNFSKSWGEFYYYHRQHKTLVVVGVLADEIHASRRVHADDGLLAEFLGVSAQRLRLDAINVRHRRGHADGFFFTPLE